MENENVKPEDQVITSPDVTEDVQPGAELPEEKMVLSEQETGSVPADAPPTASPANELAAAEEVAGGDTPAPVAKELQDDERDQEDSSEDEPESIDFENFDKAQLVAFIVPLKNETDMRRVDHLLRDMRVRYEEIYHSEKDIAFNRFMETEGNQEADFDYRGDELDERFNSYFDLLHEKRNQYFHQLGKQKDENLKKKNHILDQIRELVDGEETNVSLKAIRELQEEWKKAGPVPNKDNKLLWANYNALLDRFYDARSIYFELKELDRKKNLEAKQELCERVEALENAENLKEAIQHLNELHEEFKHIGPVPLDDQEALWQRFKTASDKVYARRKTFVDELKKDLFDNLKKKEVLGEKIEAYATFSSDRINEWNQKTKEVLALQKEWEAIGGLPRDKAKDINKKFWAGFKHFFNNKNTFFKSLEAQREENLKKKEELVAIANELKDHSDWEATANKLKQLQQQWKDIGPVPEKYRNEVYARFKEACDHFFGQKRQHSSEEGRQFEENYQAKLAICEKMELLAKSAEINLDDLFDLVDQYAELGFVPRAVIKKMNDRYSEVTSAILNSAALSEEDRSEVEITLQVNRLKGTPHGDRKIHRKESALKRRITSLENDINTFKTNMEFFSSSKKADAIKDDLNERIEKATTELEELKHQLSILRHA